MREGLQCYSVGDPMCDQLMTNVAHTCDPRGIPFEHTTEVLLLVNMPLHDILGSFRVEGFSTSLKLL